MGQIRTEILNFLVDWWMDKEVTMKNQFYLRFFLVIDFDEEKCSSEAGFEYP